MRANRKFYGNIWIAIACFCGWTWTAQAQIRDSFETDSVGKFPIRWEDAGNKPMLKQMVVVKDPSVKPDGAKVFKISFDNTSMDWMISRTFDGFNLEPGKVIEWGFKICVVNLPDSQFDSAGIEFLLHNFRTCAQIACPRTLTAQTGLQWALFNPNYAQNGGDPYAAKELDLNVWHELRFEIESKVGERRSGEVRWRLDDKHVYTEKFANISEDAAFFDAISIRPQWRPGETGNVTIHLDDLYILQKPNSGAKASR